MHDAGLNLGERKNAGDRFGKSFEPIDPAIRISATPRFLISVITRSQNLAPSLCSIQIPRISLVPAGRTPRLNDLAVTLVWTSPRRRGLAVFVA